MIKRHLTRKQKALVYALVLLLCLAYALIFHSIRLTPMQSIRAIEWRMGLEPTEIVMQKGDLYLSENEDVLILCRPTPQLLSQSLPPLVVLDKSKEGTACMTYWLMQDTVNEVITLHLVGEVFLEKANMVRVYNPEERSGSIYSTEFSVPVIPRDKGGRYFWLIQDLMYYHDQTFVVPQFLDILDKDGNVLYTCSYINTLTETIQ